MSPKNRIKGRDPNAVFLLPIRQNEKGWMLAVIPLSSSLFRIDDLLKFGSPVQS
jgi:hypothetical protein